MPYMWIEPKEIVHDLDRPIYACYKDNHPMQHWFTTDPLQDDREADYEGPCYQFDIRDIELPPAIKAQPYYQQLLYISEHDLVDWPR